MIPVSSPFGERADPFTGERRDHRGVDIPMPTGTPVYAAGDGQVIRVDRDGVGKGAVNGNAVLIQVGPLIWAYLHLSRVSVQAGDRVRWGQEIGRVGATGRATGPHLHLQVAKGDRLIDPARLYPPGTFFYV